MAASIHGADRYFTRCCQFVLLVIPWLNPVATGPSPAVLPWLVSAACAIGACVSWRRPTPQSLAGSWFLAATLSVCIGILQYFGQAHALSPWVSTAGIGEAFANLRQRNHFASLAVVGLLGLIYLDHQKASTTSRLAWFALLLGAGNGASSSRTGAVQLAGVAVAVWISRGCTLGAQRLAASAVLGYLLASLFFPFGIGQQFGSTGLLARVGETSGCSSRLVLWQNVLHLIAQKPLFGWGWGELNFSHFTTLYPGARFCEILDNAHNLPLHLAVELGIPVALAFCGLVAWLVWRAQPWKEQCAARQLAWGVLGVIGLHSLLEYPLWYGPFQITVLLCIWTIWTTPTQLEPAAGRSGAVFHRSAPVVRATTVSATAIDKQSSPGDHAGSLQAHWICKVAKGGALLTLICLAYVAWDYHRVSQIYLQPVDRSPAYRTNTLQKIQGSWLFSRQVEFAELTLTQVTPDNAAYINATAHRLLHFSPEARVVEKLIDSAQLLGKPDEVEFFRIRYKAAYPDKFEQWQQRR